MSNNALSRNPQQISDTVWYYEDPQGLVVLHEVRDKGQYLRTDQFTIPWAMVRASVARKDAPAAKKAKR